MSTVLFCLIKRGTLSGRVHFSCVCVWVISVPEVKVCIFFVVMAVFCASGVADWWGLQIKKASPKATALYGRMGGVIYKLLVATPASGISPHNTCCGCQDFSTHHTSAVTVRPRITTRTKQHRDTFFYSLFYRLLNVQVQQKLFCVVRYFLQCSQ